jgi:hypothetical protein
LLDGNGSSHAGKNKLFELGWFNRNAIIIFVIIILGIGGLLGIGYPTYSAVIVLILLLLVFFLRARAKRVDFFDDGMRIFRGSKLLAEISYSQLADFDLEYHGQNESRPTLRLKFKSEIAGTQLDREEVFPVAYSKLRKNLDLDLLNFLNQKIAEAEVEKK